MRPCRTVRDFGVVTEWSDGSVGAASTAPGALMWKHAKAFRGKRLKILDSDVLAVYHLNKVLMTRLSFNLLSILTDQSRRPTSLRSSLNSATHLHLSFTLLCLPSTFQFADQAQILFFFFYLKVVLSRSHCLFPFTSSLKCFSVSIYIRPFNKRRPPTCTLK